MHVWLERPPPSPDYYLQCKAEWDEEEFFPIDDIQHHCPIVQIMQVQVTGCVFAFHTSHGNTCEKVVKIESIKLE